MPTLHRGATALSDNADIYLLCMIKVKWCKCCMTRMLLPCGKFLGLLLFCLLLFLLSILFFKPKLLI